MSPVSNETNMATAATATRANGTQAAPSGDQDERAASCSSLFANARKVTIQLTRVNEHFICKICYGYFRDAHKIKDCAHTFCSGCIRSYFWKDKRHDSCPVCKTALGPKPWNRLVSDPAIQGLADKLLPSFKEQEEADMAAFYDKLGVKRKRADQNGGGVTRTRHAAAPSKKQPSSDSIPNHLPMQSPPPTIRISFELQPQKSRGIPLFLHLDKLPKPSMTTDPSFRISQLRKFVALTLWLTDANEIEILCRGSPVGGEYSLAFVQKTIWRDPLTRMRLEYRRSVV